MTTTPRTPLDAINRLAEFVTGEIGIEVNKHGKITDAGTTVLHTVTAGYTLKLTEGYIQTNGIDDGQAAYLFIRDTDDELDKKLIELTGYTIHTFKAITRAFPRPITVPTGYDVCLYSGGNGVLTGAISGFEERAI